MASLKLHFYVRHAYNESADELSNSYISRKEQAQVISHSILWTRVYLLLSRSDSLIFCRHLCVIITFRRLLDLLILELARDYQTRYHTAETSPLNLHAPIEKKYIFTSAMHIQILDNLIVSFSYLKASC